MTWELVYSLALSFTFWISLIADVNAQELPSGQVFVGPTMTKNDGTLFQEALYISDFKCMVKGQNRAGMPACDYYQAIISQKEFRDVLSSKVCFKESTLASVPRQYKADETYRLIYSSDELREGLISDELFHNYASQPPRLAPYPIAIIASEATGHELSWHEITHIVVYDCDTPYDGKSYN